MGSRRIYIGVVAIFACLALLSGCQKGNGGYDNGYRRTEIMEPPYPTQTIIAVTPVGPQFPVTPELVTQPHIFPGLPTGMPGISLNLQLARLEIPSLAACWSGQPTKLTVDEGRLDAFTSTTIVPYQFGHLNVVESIRSAHDSNYNSYWVVVTRNEYRLGPVDITTTRLLLQTADGLHTMRWMQTRSITGEIRTVQTCQ